LTLAIVLPSSRADRRLGRTRRAAERNGFGSRAGFACRQSEATINKREAPEPVGDGGKPGASVQTEQSHIYQNLRSPHAEAALILNFLYYIHFTRQYSCIASCGRPVMVVQRKHQQSYNRRASCKLPSMRQRRRPVRTKSLLQGPQQVRRRRVGSDQPSPHNGHDALQGRLRPEGWIRRWKGH
jgi:hypothetical protein